MGAAFENGVVTTASGSTSQSINLPQTTAANDCIVVVLSVTSQVNPTVSGAGATWTREVNGASTNPSLSVCVGYGATAGNTSITVTEGSAANFYYGIAMFSGFGSSNPYINQATNSGTSWPLATSSLSYQSGDLLVAVGTQHNGSSQMLTPTWSDGSTNNNVGGGWNSGRGISISMDYVIEATASSTDISYAGSSSNQGAVALIQLRPSTSPTATPGLIMFCGQ